MNENDVARATSVAAAAPVVASRSPWFVLFAWFAAVLTADSWASACPAKPLPEFLEAHARGTVLLLFYFAMAGAIGRGRPWNGLREPLFLVPLYLVKLVPSVLSLAVAWEGGWILGIAGAAVGVAAGIAMGWMFTRWTLPEIENRPRERVRIALPISFALLFAAFGAYTWAVAWMKPEHAWGVAVAWILLALPGALVGRPFRGLVVASPLVLLILVPAVGSITVGWEGGWNLGIAGAAVGAAAGTVKGWLFFRWIMPEYDKRRARASTVRPPGSGSSGSMAKCS